MIIKQSKQTPIPQNNPRGAPLKRVYLVIRSLLVKSAALTLWPELAKSSTPLKIKVIIALTLL